MPRVTNIELLQRREQPTITIRARTKVENLPQLIGESYVKIISYLNELAVSPEDIPFVAYYNMDMQDLDVEIGFPVANVLAEKGDIKPSSVPAGRAVFCIYRGPYNEMPPTYEEMSRWIGEKGLSPLGTAYEYYLNGPGFPESELLTKIVLPIT